MYNAVIIVQMTTETIAKKDNIYIIRFIFNTHFILINKK